MWQCDRRSLDIISGVKVCYVNDYTAPIFRNPLFAGTYVEQLIKCFPKLRNIIIGERGSQLPWYELMRTRKKSRKTGHTWVVMTNLTRRIDQLAYPPRAPFKIPNSIHAIWRYGFFANHYIGTPPSTVTDFSPLGDQIFNFTSDTTMSFGFTHTQLKRCCERRRCPRIFNWRCVIIKLPHFTLEQLRIILQLLQPEHIRVYTFEIHMTHPGMDGMITWELLRAGPGFWRLFNKFSAVELHFLHGGTRASPEFYNSIRSALNFGEWEPLNLKRLIINLQPPEMIPPNMWTDKKAEDFTENYLLFMYAMQEIVGPVPIESHVCNRGANIPARIMTNLCWWFEEQLPMRHQSRAGRREYLEMLVDGGTFSTSDPTRRPDDPLTPSPSAKKAGKAKESTVTKYGSIEIIYDKSATEPDVKIMIEPSAATTTKPSAKKAVLPSDEPPKSAKEALEALKAKYLKNRKKKT